ncbi:MAG TPA: hypothetical protein VGQ41_17035 [Pyrinomonadaceae bacterium]|jgi:hypothetical protein|nr:hypothetical protein [Pyrinomonadaceae bacterium]
MKSIIGAFVLTLFVVCLALPGLVLACSEGATATGSFKFELEDGETRFVEFKAQEGTEGQATGEMTFSDPAAAPVEDPDNPEGTKTEGVLVKAKFDCMQVNENRAVIGGEIYDSNVLSNIGQRVLLVIEDNGLEKDQLTWGIYPQPAKGWVPTDAELEDDKGAGLTWIATDFERSDDVGIPSDLSKVVTCKSFPLGSYEFPEIKTAGGDLQVSKQ